jgi:hypothetical protein
MDVAGDVRLRLKLEHIRNEQRTVHFAANDEMRRMNFANHLAEFADDHHARLAFVAPYIAAHGAVDAQAT